MVCNQVNLLQYFCGLIQTNNKCESFPVFNQLCCNNDDFSSYDKRELLRAIISAYRNDWDINTLQEHHKNIILSIDENTLNLLKQAMPAPEESSFNPAVKQDSEPQISIWCDPNIEPRYALYHSCRNRINDCLYDTYNHVIQLPPLNENAKDLCNILGVNDIVAIDGSGDHLGDNKACNESFDSVAFGLALHKAQSLVFTKVLNSIAFLLFAISTFSSLLQEAHIILTAAIPIKNRFFIMIGFKLLNTYLYHSNSFLKSAIISRKSMALPVFAYSSS